MSRIHNIMLIRGISIVVAFSIFFHALALTNQISLIETVSIIGVPVVFIGFIHFSNHRSSFWLLVPLTVYLFDRFFIYVWKGIDGLNDGLDGAYSNDTLAILFQLNSVRLVFSLIFVLFIISAITSKQKEWVYKMHHFAVGLLVLQGLEIGLWVASNQYQLSPSLIAQMLIVPSLIYFPVFMIFLTRLHIHEVFVEQGMLHASNPSPEEIRSPQNQPTAAPPKPKPSTATAPPKKPAAKPASSAPASSHTNRSSKPTPPPQIIKCPQCGTENKNTHVCQTCGQSLK